MPMHAIQWKNAGGNVKRKPFSTLLFYVSAAPFAVSLALFALGAHSEIPVDRIWDVLQRPTCCKMILCGLSAAGMLLAGTIQAVSAARRPGKSQRGRVVVCAALSAVAALASMIFASLAASELAAAKTIFECFGPSAHPGVVRILSFYHHPASLVYEESWEAWIEFRAGSTDDFTDALHVAALGDEKEAVRLALDAFPSFHVAQTGTVHCVRDGSGFEGWIVPGDSPDRCVIIAWRSAAP